MFENKRHIYTFENICREDREILLGDGSHRIFLCAEGEADDCSDKMKDFLNYVAKREVKGELSQRIRQEVEESRKHEKWRLDYMTLLEHYKEEREEGRKEGRKEGLEEGRTEERKNGIRIFIEDKLEDNTPKCKIVDKLVKNYDLTAEEADEYITQYSAAVISEADNAEG
jgi:flagellar biosynthesis/type III secretory pathway protein FliH